MFKKNYKYFIPIYWIYFINNSGFSNNKKLFISTINLLIQIILTIIFIKQI